MKKLPKTKELRETLIVQKRVEVENDYGEIEESLTDIVTVYAKVTALDPVVTVAGAAKELDEYDYKAMFYSPNIGIDSNQYITWRGSLYAIKKVVADPVNRFTTIYVKSIGVEAE